LTSGSLRRRSVPNIFNGPGGRVALTTRGILFYRLLEQLYRSVSKCLVMNSLDGSSESRGYESEMDTPLSFMQLRPEKPYHHNREGYGMARETVPILEGIRRNA